jgi:hypothetical protein
MLVLTNFKKRVKAPGTGQRLTAKKQRNSAGRPTPRFPVKKFQNRNFLHEYTKNPQAQEVPGVCP